MRQAGILAAAGIIALEEMPGRLHEDHANERALAEGLCRSGWFDVDLARVRTNNFFCGLSPDAPLDVVTLASRLRADGILVGARGAGFRFVTHYWVRPQQVEQVLGRIRFHLA
jgi:threonine aldolase